ncbi:DNA-binding LacI/PurR family transcriptional regulator [Diaminobutyricimonas aerilata]|uniref:DNA-binding LacI/PurR family transcriptional regulator n=1 Tax=Diaminobutyricimonas aerilata TaxID=1162967 RepID=A0A2M9CFY5_9MICO|nr:LacI family DNA-binding transcriptional regulator [Diaminobutyricimonas aerilata]PJJ70770.1 DNA-binding LacI/PurR family transcriptional regulator [Diaminobutyricimonas aerilata]
MGRVTLQDVAEHAGVSMKTVSNVVAGYRHVSPRMRERVQAAIDELGYRPNRSGRSLATGRSSMLALAFPDLRRPYFAELAHVFARVADARGYRLLLAETGGTADGERAVLHDRESGTIDGIVIHPQALSAAELDELSDGTPIVFLGEDPQPIGADQVAVDNVAAAETAVDHLLRSGRRRIGFLGHEVGTLSRTSALRIRGYRNALERAGLAFDPALLVPRTDGDAPGAEEALHAALGRGVAPDALLCRDDLAAIGALRALRRHGLEVPADVAVVGWDAIDLGASTAPSLTSVAPDTRTLAERALDLLLERLDGLTEPGRHVTVGHGLVFRESAPEVPGSAISA